MNAAFFTRPVRSVPHDRLDVRWMLLLHEAITHAFALIRAEGFDLANAGENQITERLEDMLENRIRNRGVLEGFDSDFFGSISRGSETVNYNGKKISKKPDLVFRLRREHRTDWDQRQDAVFAECKPVDKKRPLKDHYCAVAEEASEDSNRYAAIERFVIGDYAWAMEQAFVIAYVADGFAVRPDLENSLNDSKRRKRLGSPSSLTLLDGCGAEGLPPLYVTTHQRLFPWRETGQQATPIDLYHSWHSCN